MILIYPPVAKPSEPPAGIARISGALNLHGVRHRILDANLEGLLSLLQRPLSTAEHPSDRWTLRAFRNRPENLLSLRRRNTYSNFDDYTRIVLEVNRVLGSRSISGDVAIGLANYEDRELSPVKSGDLIRAAEDPERNVFYPYFEKRLVALMAEKRPAVAGFSLNYLSQALCTFAMAGFIRRIFPGVKIVLGGGLVTSWMKRPNWKNPFGGLVDHLVAGPGESPLLSMAGIHDVTKESAPDYSSFPKHDYLSPGFILPYSASRGCFWRRCSFCPEKTENNAYAPVPVDRVLTDISGLREETRPVLVHFLDNAMSVSLMTALPETMGGGMPWYGFARISRELTDAGFCEALKRSGCVMLKLGLESGDQRVLDRMEKGIDLGIASRALRTLKKAGITTYVYLLFGTPWESAASARKTLEFTVRHNDAIGFLNLAIFNMPVCGNGREVVTRSFYDADLSLYTDFLHPEGWDRKRVRQFLENEFRKAQGISSILKKDPPLFTSNHAPFFAMN